jgi:hypothetical protein
VRVSIISFGRLWRRPRGLFPVPLLFFLLGLHGLLGRSPEDSFAVLDDVELIDVGRVGAIAAVDVILPTVQLVYGPDRVIATATVQSVRIIYRQHQPGPYR